MDPSRRNTLLRYVEESIPANQYSPVTIGHIRQDDAQDTINIVWDVSRILVEWAAAEIVPFHKLLGENSGSQAVGLEADRVLLPYSLRRLLAKLSAAHQLLPTAFYIKETISASTHSLGAGGHLDTYTGS